MSRPKMPSQPQPYLKQAVDKLIHKGQRGDLKEEDFQDFRDRFQTVSFFHTRKRYAEAVSEPLFTVEWMDSMARLLKGYRVVEILSYRGVLIQPMTQRGIEWVGADEHPKLTDVGGGKPWNARRIVPPTHPFSPRQAIEDLNPDIVVMGRLRKKDDDYEILDICREQRLPLLLLRDSQSGWGDTLWTSALMEDFHTHEIPLEPIPDKKGRQFPYYLYEASCCFPWFKDVPNWHDGDVRTWFVLPTGTGLVVEGQVVAGPPPLENE